MTTTDQLYCYHCGKHHPREEMRQIEQKGRKRWRCIKSIEGSQKGSAERAAFGKSVTAINRADQQSRVREKAALGRLASSFGN